MELWLWWVLAAIALFIGEIFTSGFFLMWLGVAALLGALIALLGGSPGLQGLAFVLASGGLIVSSRTLFRRLFLRARGERALATNVEALVDKVGVVTEAIPSGGRGRVKLDGEEWTAVSEDDQPIAQGRRVRVVRIEGVKAIVSEEP